MDYVIVFLEGITTFISPCLLPMLPVYVSYFTGQNAEAGKARTVLSALGFVLGFTLVFVLMGAFAGTVGKFVRQYQTAVNLVTGLVVILFGLNFLGIIRLPFLNRHTQGGLRKNRAGFFPSILFGAVFSVGWTPCVGAFLGSALMLAAQQGGLAKGILMLLAYSLGLGIPFVASAVLIDRLKSAFDFIKRHYRVINIVSGSLLILVGVLMATGYMGYFLSLLSV